MAAAAASVAAATAQPVTQQGAVAAAAGAEPLAVAVARRGADEATSEATVEVEFAQAGSLGIKFHSKTAADPPEIKAITAGGLAARLGEARLRPGLVLAAVQGVSVAGQPFAQALQRLKEASRPLRLTFVDVGAAAAASAAAVVVRTACL